MKPFEITGKDKEKWYWTSFKWDYRFKEFSWKNITFKVTDCGYQRAWRVSSDCNTLTELSVLLFDFLQEISEKEFEFFVMFMDCRPTLEHFLASLQAS